MKPQKYYNTYQLKLPVDLERILEISDPVYTFCEVLDSIDLYKYLVEKEHKTGRPRYDSYTLLRVILFAFMENGYVSTRKIEKLCKTDIRFMWLLNGNPAPSHMTIDNFMKNDLVDSIESIFAQINNYIFEKDHVDIEHIYIDGTKIRANANMYSWVWKKSSIKNRDKTFVKVTDLLEKMNEVIAGFGVKFGTRNEYVIEYLEDILKKYAELTGIKPDEAVRGRGHRKTIEMRYYDLLKEYTEKLKKYA